ncbi:MAG: leucine-rich repeat domain-containing protein [Candidatus Lokiarchaeota archaeon]|nr:leucine-rich repeat domain-containing protein [Candidatus Lokiarchaeota archaeon]
MLIFQIIIFCLITLTIYSIRSTIGTIAREFKINDYLTLKLQNNRTNIYVKNKIFTQCMYLLLNIPVDRIRDYDPIDSIDEAAEVLDRSLEGSRSPPLITPEEEFVGHCSNIQFWAENDYDTRILHRNLAFPLLRRLSDVGDPLAKKKFKEEIALRYSSGHSTVITFLNQNGYLKYLSSEELGCLLDDNKLPILVEISNSFKRILDSVEVNNLDRYIQGSTRYLKNNLGVHNIPFVISYILKDFSESQRKKLVRSVFNCVKTDKDFPLVNYLNNNLKYFDDLELNTAKYNDRIIGLFNEQILDLRYQNIEYINRIEDQKNDYENVQELDLSNNNIKDLDGIENFINLRTLNLNNNKIRSIKNLDKLKELREVSFRNNNITEIENIEGLTKLEHLDLSGNTKIYKIPDFMNDMESLTVLKLANCSIKEFSEDVAKFFWNDQNYRYYSDYSQADVSYYERTHREKASSNNQLYKKFVKWVLKFKSAMLELDISYKDLVIYERSTSKRAIWNWKATNDFKRWLFNKKQTSITAFM